MLIDLECGDLSPLWDVRLVCEQVRPQIVNDTPGKIQKR
jgi:hypothetical protein